VAIKIFAERLKELREKKGYSQRELSCELGFGHGTVGQYEAMLRTPDIEKCMNIAKYFNVSTDYLIGLTDNPERRQ
jgi:transcriptional regulator with XRE-family HTH domain